jgi:hypothetical protein
VEKSTSILPVFARCLIAHGPLSSSWALLGRASRAPFSTHHLTPPPTAFAMAFSCCRAFSSAWSMLLGFRPRLSFRAGYFSREKLHP